MTDGTEKIPLDEWMCLEQFAQTLCFVASMQGDPRIKDAGADAGRRCAELFDAFYAADDRTEYLTMLGFLAMDLAANVAYTLDRAALRTEVGE